VAAAHPGARGPGIFHTDTPDSRWRAEIRAPNENVGKDQCYFNHTRQALARLSYAYLDQEESLCALPECFQYRSPNPVYRVKLLLSRSRTPAVLLAKISICLVLLHIFLHFLQDRLLDSCFHATSLG
jgi:hypothetical protein